MCSTKPETEHVSMLPGPKQNMFRATKPEAVHVSVLPSLKQNICLCYQARNRTCVPATKPETYVRATNPEAEHVSVLPTPKQNMCPCYQPRNRTCVRAANPETEHVPVLPSPKQNTCSCYQAQPTSDLLTGPWHHDSNCFAPQERGAAVSLFVKMWGIIWFVWSLCIDWVFLMDW